MNRQVNSATKTFGNIMIPVIALPILLGFIVGWFARAVCGSIFKGWKAADNWSKSP